MPEVDASVEREATQTTSTASAERRAPAQPSRPAEPQPAAVASTADAEPAVPVEAETTPTLSKTDLGKQELAAKVDGATIAPSGETGGFGAEEGWLAALAALLGLGAIGGGAYAATRRRRRLAGDAAVAEEAGPEVMESARPTPAFASAAPRVSPSAPAIAGTVAQSKMRPLPGRLTDHIDYSQQPGYYEAQVDQGPTPINPFLTTRKRITRARFLDRQLQLAQERRKAASRADRSTQRPPVREHALEPA